MRLLFLLVLVVGILIAGFAGFTALQLFAGYDQEITRLEKLAAKNVKTSGVVIVAKPLGFGKVLERDDVKVVRFPVSAIPKNAFRSLDEVFGKKEEEKAPRAVLRIMEPLEVLAKSKVSEFGEDAGIASRLGKGKRAFTLRVDVASGVSGFLRPGNTIDVFWTGRVAKQTITRLILDGIQLIAIDQISDEDRNRPYVARTVTVSVTPQVVAALAQAQATGKLQLSLRGTGDTEETGLINFTQNDLLGREVVAAKKRKVCTIKSRKGAEVKTITIPCPKE
jgi:pilus assembly protein CpaB